MTAPTKMALVPVEPSSEMLTGATGWGHIDDDMNEFQHTVNNMRSDAASTYHAMLAASPSSGRLSAADLERAAEAHYEAAWSAATAAGLPLDAWSDLMPGARQAYISRQRAAFAAIGLPVEGEQG